MTGLREVDVDVAEFWNDGMLAGQLGRCRSLLYVCPPHVQRCHQIMGSLSCGEVLPLID